MSCRFDNVNNAFGNAMLWGVRARLRPPTKVRTRNVLLEVLKHGFKAHGLHSVHAWVVDCNRVSSMLMRSIGMTEMGRMRQCHLLDGVPHDRLLFDITQADFAAQAQALAGADNGFDGSLDGDATGDEA